MKVISFFNLKGGCGKTTSVVNLGYLLAEDLKEKNGKVLLVDLDMQANLTNSLMDYDLDRPSVYHFLADDTPIEDVIYEVRENIDINKYVEYMLEIIQNKDEVKKAIY